MKIYYYILNTLLQLLLFKKAIGLLLEGHTINFNNMKEVACMEQPELQGQLNCRPYRGTIHRVFLSETSNGQSSTLPDAPLLEDCSKTLQLTRAASSGYLNEFSILSKAKSEGVLEVGS